MTIGSFVILLCQLRLDTDPTRVHALYSLSGRDCSMSFHEEFSHLEVFGKAVGGNTDDRQPKSASRKTKKQQTTKTSQEKMPGELKRWFLVLIRRRKQRTFDQL